MCDESVVISYDNLEIAFLVGREARRGGGGEISMWIWIEG